MCERSLNVIIALLALLALLIVVLLCAVIYKCHVDCQNERQRSSEIEEMKLLLRGQPQAILEPDVDREKIEKLYEEKFKNQLKEQQKANSDLQSKLKSLEKTNKHLAEVVSSLKKHGVIMNRKNTELTEQCSMLRKNCAQLGVVCRKLECNNKVLMRDAQVVFNAEFYSFKEAVDGMLQISAEIELLLLKRNKEVDTLTVGEIEYHLLTLRTILMDLEKQEKKSQKQPTQQVKAASVLPCSDQGNNKAA
ncbi:hypothetical protein [Ehrlichia canis]|uniref:hypothetical protein n=1 Tax=Ehrlichia canis TaxID=944 RepID=UPI001F29791E|nr:hypothetical protein [Ehrlichia canis]UKC53463.1 hypothetical protein s20019040002_000506 [Ehrlichia canis]UKC54399.1 hypothetical protein s20026770001_000505 [Ehrlichia canis]UKC55336.1 hypothetical protein s21009500007_000506 [Ehrlichia canis]